MTIVISRSLYLSPPVDEDMAAGVIGYHSLIPYGNITTEFDGGAEEEQRQLWSSDTYTKFTSPDVVNSSTTAIYINLTPAEIGPINYVLIAGHNLGYNTHGLSVSYKTQYSDDGVTWTDAIELKSQTDNRAIMMVFDSQSKPLWRVVLIVPIWDVALNPFNVIVAHVRAGARLRLQRRRFVGETPSSMDKRTEVVSSIGDTGQLLDDKVVSETCRYSIDQDNNTGEFVRQYILPFLDHCRKIGNTGYGPKGSFGYAWRPETYPKETLYCFAPISLTAPSNHVANGFMQWSLSGSALA